MIRKSFILICLALVAFVANAQTITDDLRTNKQGSGKVIINQSADIERLVNNASVQAPKKTEVKTTAPVAQERPQDDVTKKPVKVENGENAISEQQQPATTNQPETAEEKPAAPKTNSERRIVSGYTTSGDAPSSPNSKKIMRRSYKATGYRIQVYAGGNTRADRQKCEQISARLKTRFPNLPIYVHFYSPSWKCRIGNFKNVEDAQAILKQVRGMGYSQACLVKGAISVQY